MASSEPYDLSFTLDANDIIVAAEARECWETDFDSASIGSHFFSHVDGLETAAFLGGILNSARNGHRPAVPYRCDTPARTRRWLMRVEKASGSDLFVRHTMLEDRPRDHAWSFRTSSNLVGAIPRCSLCNRIFHDNGWCDPHDGLILPAASATRTRIIEVIHEICLSCSMLVPRGLS